MNKTMTLKRLAVVAFAALAVMSALAEDSYLYWMIEQTPGTYCATPFDYATIKQDGALLNMYAPETLTELGTEVVSDIYSGGDGYSMDEGAYTRLNSVSGGSFLVELWRDGESERVGFATYDRAAIEDYIVNSFNMSGGQPFRVTQPELIPEPSSGLLLLLGMAGLALRRRRAPKSKV